MLAVWLYWNFTGWLNILNCTLPPVGIILVMSFFMDREKYKDVEVPENVNWFAVFGVVLGAVVANLVPWGIASINGMIVAAVCYLVGSKSKSKQNQKILGLTQGQPNLLTLRFDRGFLFCRNTKMRRIYSMILNILTFIVSVLRGLAEKQWTTKGVAD